MTASTRFARRPFVAAPILPGDKSITHRAFLLAALARGDGRVRGGNGGEDCARSLAALRALGVGWRRDGNDVMLEGAGGDLRPPTGPIDCGNSGTTLRLLLGVLAGQAFEATLTGDASLRRRPMERVLEPLRAMGVIAAATGGVPPVTLRGGALLPIRHRMAVASAQVKSALLLAGARAAGTTVVEGGGRSRDHTERLLRAAGADLRGGGDRVEITGPSRLRLVDLDIPGDPSAAAFHLVAAAIVPGSRVELAAVSLNPTRTRLLDTLASMGLSVSRSPDPEEGPEPSGTLVATGGALRGIRVESDAVPELVDELPALAVAAAFATGTTRVRGAAELRVKESDRLAAVGAGLRAIGARVHLLPDGWEIEGSAGEPLPGGDVRSEGDHRVAMAFLVAGLRCLRGVRLLDAPGIETSDPHFLSNLQKIMESAS